jgi:hypothetical protein
MSETRRWIECSVELPPEGKVVTTRSPGGMKQTLVRDGNLWFFPDRSMYVYYSPEAWCR